MPRLILMNQMFVKPCHDVGGGFTRSAGLTLVPLVGSLFCVPPSLAMLAGLRALSRCSIQTSLCQVSIVNSGASVVVVSHSRHACRGTGGEYRFRFLVIPCWFPSTRYLCSIEPCCVSCLEKEGCTRMMMLFACRGSSFHSQALVFQSLSLFSNICQNEQWRRGGCTSGTVSRVNKDLVAQCQGSKGITNTKMQLRSL